MEIDNIHYPFYVRDVINKIAYGYLVMSDRRIEELGISMERLSCIIPEDGYIFSRIYRRALYIEGSPNRNYKRGFNPHLYKIGLVNLDSFDRTTIDSTVYDLANNNSPKRPLILKAIENNRTCRVGTNFLIRKGDIYYKNNLVGNTNKGNLSFSYSFLHKRFEGLVYGHL
jgi:hypothetical protein